MIYLHSYILTPYPKPFSLPAQYRWMTNNKDQRANYCLHPFELRTSFLLLNGPVAHTLAVFFLFSRNRASDQIKRKRILRTRRWRRIKLRSALHMCVSYWECIGILFFVNETQIKKQQSNATKFENVGPSRHTARRVVIFVIFF